MQFAQFLEWLQALIWSKPMLACLLAIGTYLTITLNGLQFRYLLHSLRLSFGKDGNGESKTPGDVSNFQALMTSLAAAIGTGNIAGVATALVAGGMGALFWMWVIAALGMAIKYCEAFLAVKYRVENAHGEMSGGPMYYLLNGLAWKKMAFAYALFGAIAAIGTGNMVQINSIADSLEYLFPLPRLMIGISLAFTSSLVLIGGVRSIGKIAGVFVPIMAGFYLIGGTAIIMMNYEKVPSVIALIIRSAFTGQAASGGFLGASLGACIQAGISRGIFSNEAGLGTSSIASAAAKTTEPGEQGLVSMTSAFISTIVLCTVTGLVIGVTGVLGYIDPSSGKAINGAPMAMEAFGLALPFGRYFVSIGLICFAYSTVLAWAYYGEKCVEFLIGLKAVRYYRVIYILCMIPAAVLELELVWSLADITNGLMLVPNLLGLIGLSALVRKETRLYLAKR